MPALIATKFSGPKKEFPLTGEGIQNVTISEIKDLGMQPIDAQYRREGGPTERHEVRVRFSAGDGTSMVRKYTVSLHEKSNLSKDLKQIFGKDPGEKLDLFSLVGTNARAVVTHNEGKDGKIYANIASFMKAAPGQKSVVTTPVTQEEFAGGAGF